MTDNFEDDFEPMVHADDFSVPVDGLSAVERLLLELKKKARSLHRREARCLVKAYYEIQRHRVNSASNIRASIKANEVPNDVLQWAAMQFETLEKDIVKILDIFSSQHEAGRWAKRQCGIGPVLAAGLLAHIDVNKSSTHGDVWHHAGLIPGLVKKKGETQSWNSDLRMLCWKIGESFVMFHKKPNCFYGKLWREKKDIYQAKNEAGEYAGQCAEILASKNFNKSTDAYKAYSEGKLPPAHVHARARRFAVKIFLSHFFEIEYQAVHGKEPPLPYAMAHLGHAHRIKAPA